MERQNLKEIEQKILEYIERISYDSTIDFMAFKIDIYRNIEKFFSSDSLEYYFENSKILRNVELKQQKEMLYPAYLMKLRKELTEFIMNIKPTDSKEFENDRMDIIEDMVILLNPYEYKNNIKALSNKQQKRLTLPRGWC